jgi:uncharacterized protein YqjF (DUF2071 family)
MFSFKNHPFSVKAFFERSIVLTFAVPRDELKDLIPECLQLDTFDDQWAFIAVAFVQTKNLRPGGFPEFLGNDFFLSGFRIFVKYINNKGKRLRGLYILKSETDKKKMSFLGNVFTHYNYTTTDITFNQDSKKILIFSKRSKIDIEIKLTNPFVDLPKNSPFRYWKEARRFAGPLPFTFSYNKSTKKVLIIEGVRKEWHPKPVEVVKYQIDFVDQKAFNHIVLANAFMIEHIPYLWKKGKTELWKG